MVTALGRYALASETQEAPGISCAAGARASPESAEGRESSLRPGQEADLGRIALKQAWRTSVRDHVGSFGKSGGGG